MFVCLFYTKFFYNTFISVKTDLSSSILCAIHKQINVLTDGTMECLLLLGACLYLLLHLINGVLAFLRLTLTTCVKLDAIKGAFMSAIKWALL